MYYTTYYYQYCSMVLEICCINVYNEGVLFRQHGKQEEYYIKLPDGIRVV